MKRINLFCLPYAGGSKYAFQDFDMTDCNIQVTPLELPGRGSRMKEKLRTDLNGLVDDVFELLRNQLEQPYAFYGHSMGSLLAFIAAKKIIRENLPRPIHLFLSGSQGPSVPDDEPPYHLLKKEAFIDKLRELGGCPDEILNDHELFSFFEPVIRSDLQAIETFHYDPSEPIDIPITVMIGKEERATYEKAMAWQKETIHKIEIIEFPGNHFFIFSQREQVVNVIKSKLRQPVFQSIEGKNQ